jgi:hypothetical protein
VTPRGTIFLVGGINDVVLVGRGWARWLAAELPHRIEVVRWQQGFWATLTFADLWRTAHHRATAAGLADGIRRAQAEHPGGPVHVLAHSAGTAITAYTLEQLDPAAPVTSAVFVGSGLSAGYDLSRALGRTAAGILSVESLLDTFFLGVGTSLLGSADRVWGPAAGMVGFADPSDPEQAAKLHRARWTPWDVRQGWLGGHVSVGTPWFVRQTLVPWVQRAEGEMTGSGLRANTQSSTG